MKKIKTNSYDIYLGKGIINRSEEIINSKKDKIIITDENVYKLNIHKSMNLSNVKKIIVIKAGEKSKSLKCVEKIIDEMLEENFNRESMLVALGGGVVGDIVGFVGSIYFRGVEVVQIPTTLLSMVDSSVGGKTGINYKNCKNSIGSFYNPSAVIIDVDLLETLESREIRSGLGEIIKYGFIKDEEIIKILEKNGLEENKANIIYKCLSIKKEIVEEDGQEKGIRKILNFGHTIGHSIESCTNFEKYSHGEAVGLGMVKMMYKNKNQKRLINLLKKLNMPYEIKLDVEKIIEIIKFDKKSVSKEEINIVVIDEDEIGKCEIKKVTYNYLKNYLEEGEK